MKRTFGQVSAKLIELALLHGFPVYGQFEITSRCNLRCSMCYVSSDIADAQTEIAELSAGQLLDLAEQARDLGMVFINITGGEPLIKKDFWDFYDGLCRLGLIITLNTNGTTVTREIAAKLAKSPPYRVLVSLYGAGEEVYEKMTGSAKAFNLARKGVENLLEAGINVLLRTTLVRDNYKDYQALSQWADSLNHDLRIVDYISPRREGNGSNPAEVRMDMEQVEYVYKIIRDKINASKLNEQNENNESLALAEKESSLLQPDDFTFWEENTPAEVLKDPRPAFRCAAARSSFLLAHDGKMIPCGLLDEPVAYPLKAGLKASWEQLKQDSFKIPACSACQDCEHDEKCGHCPARLKLETGFYDKIKPDYLCGMTDVFRRVFITQNNK